MTRVLRLRPVVRATRIADGLHLRGWASSCTITGGPGLWTVWQRLAPPLLSGVPAGSLGAPEGTAPAVRAAVELILEQLREHDMLVEMPEWGVDGPSPDVAAWLESVSAEPVSAWERLRAAAVTVSGSGLPAETAARAAEVVGLEVRRGDGSTGGNELVVGAGDVAVLAGCGAEVGYVLPVTTTLSSFDTEITTRTASRLGLTGEPTEVLATLIGSAAVHRLICALADLPDPATPLAEAGYPMALVARTGPLRAGYHPLLTGPPPPDPWQRLAALTDPELGPVETPKFGTLPQVPANLATSGNALGTGTTADTAGLTAALNALKIDGVLGITELHARGAALRLAARSHTGEPAPAHDWTADPTCHRWWKALTKRFAQAAVIEVRQLAPNAYKAEIRRGHQVLAWAVEATARDAVAFAALAATGHAQAARHGIAHLNGAIPQRTVTVPDWAGREWRWPGAVQDNEEKLQRALEQLPNTTVKPFPLDPELHAAGLVAYTVDDPR